MKNLEGSVLNVLNQLRDFAHVMTVTLLWHVQNFVVIGRICYEQEHDKVSLNFEFDWNIVSDTATRSILKLPVVL